MERDAFTDERPPLTRDLKAGEFREYYWLKEELRLFCSEYGIRSHGAKREIEERIIRFLSTGETAERNRPSPRRRDDKEPSMEQIIGEGFSFGQKNRAFFRESLGPGFRFSVPLMEFVRNSVGKEYREIAAKWMELEADRRKHSNKKEIAPQFEYNRYVRDFMTDNPGVSRKDAIDSWMVKSRKKGTNSYEKGDLDELRQRRG